MNSTSFSTHDLELIDTCKQIEPIIFLNAIKDQKQSFVVDQETRLVNSLVERSPLTDSVINVLIHYILVVQKNSTLQPNFINRIATDWAERGITEPEQAIIHVRNLYKKTQEKKNARKQNYSNSYRKSVRKEVLPDWVDKEYVEEENLEAIAAMDKRLQEYLANKNKEKG